MLRVAFFYQSDCKTSDVNDRHVVHVTGLFNLNDQQMPKPNVSFRLSDMSGPIYRTLHAEVCLNHAALLQY